MLSIQLRWGLHIILVACHLFGMLLFLRGFFPSKVVLPGFSTFETSSPFGVLPGSKANDTPKFDKFILMVVDAMRADYMYSESFSDMTFLHQLINEGNAIPFTAFSNPPTVTLPRLKGITTGGTPSFLDAILNVADDKDQSQGLSSQDSWVSQFLNQNKTINFFGDDTWLKLFPNRFQEFEGTNSFFVSDFSEVDTNVTRHLDAQLDSSKWDGLILHYLGLDHIGHKGGPNSVFMKPKQREMDSVLKRLYDYTCKNDDTLIVLMGDHGMNEIGNHGGSSLGETSAGLSFISPKFHKSKSNRHAPVPDTIDYSYFSKINQIDLVPTLASLLNFPIPKNNLGILIPDMLDLWKNSHQQRMILWENCKQMRNLFVAKYGNHDSEHTEINEKWEYLQGDSKSTNQDYYTFLESIQNTLASSATNYNYDDIFIGFLLISVSTIVLLILFNYYVLKISSVSVSLIVFFEAFIILYSVHFHGSSLIEEEHQIWWLFSITSLVMFGIYNYKVFNKKILFNSLIVLTGLRIIRSWNNSGQKFFSTLTTASYLLSSPTLLWTLILLTYLAVSLSIYIQGGFVDCLNYENNGSHFHNLGSLVSFMLIFVTASISFLFKLCQYYNDGYKPPVYLMALFKWVVGSYDLDIDTTLDSEIKFELQRISIQLSQLSGYCIFALFLIRILLGKVRKVRYATVTDCLNIIALFLLHQSRFENIPIFMVFYLTKYGFTQLMISMNEKVLNTDEFVIILTVFTICLQNLSFFSMGNTNSLATVDLSNAYNGIKSYDVLLVGLLTFISNYSGPIFWSLSSLQILFEPFIGIFDSNNHLKNLANYKGLTKTILLLKSSSSLLFYSIGATNLIGSCINLRFHLFIWTVFSPKLLFFGAWSILMNCLVDLIIALILISM